MFYKIAKAIIKPLIYLLYRPRITGMNNLPVKGKTIIYSNHTSLLDPIILGCVLPRKIHFMAKEELFKIPLISLLVRNLGAFPVKRGTADISAVKNALKVLKNGKVFGIFPEGTRNKTGNIREFSHGIASIAIKSKAPVIPIIIKNGYSLFKRIDITIGTSVDLEKYYGERANTELLVNVSSEMEEALRICAGTGNKI